MRKKLVLATLLAISLLVLAAGGYVLVSVQLSTPRATRPIPILRSM